MFVGKDVATALGYVNTLKAIRDHVDIEDKGVNEMVTPGGTQKVVFINESGLYALILSSKLPQAKAFKRWVTSEVLPQIRQTGGYIPTKDAQGRQLSNEEIIDRADAIFEVVAALTTIDPAGARHSSSELGSALAVAALQCCSSYANCTFWPCVQTTPGPS